jgi:hypothetical protein
LGKLEAKWKLSMKLTSLKLVILPVVIGFFGVAPVLAQAPAATQAPESAPLPPPMLDNDEMVQLHKAREQVLAANPDVKAEEKKFKALHDAVQNQVPPPTADQRNAMFAEWKAYQKTMRAAMLKIDPTLGPIFAKLDAARKHGAPSPCQPATAK